VFWAGAIFTLARFVLPAVAATGPAGQQFMRQLTMVQGLTKTMTMAGLIARSARSSPQASAQWRSCWPSP